MANRFFSDRPILGAVVRLGGAEAHHLLHVMRARTGSPVVLFDGSGDEFTAEITELGRSEAVLAITGRTTVDRELPFQLVLAVALPKGDRQRWLVEKAVELGVSRLVPLVTERGVAQPRESAIQRLQRAGIEASKQSGRNRLMEIGAAQEWAHFAKSCQHAQTRLIAHPSGGLPASRVQIQPGPGPIAIAVGPEGGFSDEEIEIARRCGWQTVDLGPRILRVETAALAMATLVSLAAGSPDA